MLQVTEYDRAAAVEYAHRWAYGRNPRYLDFSNLGGDCTNFASQCVYAGAGVMNETPVYGWFYRSGNDRTASWTGVKYFYAFLIRNLGEGPFAVETSLSQIEPGDPIQIITAGNTAYHHTPIVVRVDGTPTIDTVYVAAHSNDCDCRPLSSYKLRMMRCLHIEGVRKQI